MWILVRRYGFSPEYIDNLPPAERQLLLEFGKEEENAREEEAKKAKNDGKGIMYNGMNIGI